MRSNSESTAGGTVGAIVECGVSDDATAFYSRHVAVIAG